MSTKSTIAYGPDFHLYHEGLDTKNVYLEIEGIEFEAERGRVMMAIPVHIWEVIRQFAGTSLSYADLTDEELRWHVEEAVDARIKSYAEASGKMRSIISLSGMLAFGEASESREKQIAQGLAHLTREREHQRKIQLAIQELEQMNRGSGEK